MHWGYEDLTSQQAWGEGHESYQAIHYMFPAHWNTLMNTKHVDDGINQMRWRALSPQDKGSLRDGIVTFKFFSTNETNCKILGWVLRVFWWFDFCNESARTHTQKSSYKAGLIYLQFPLVLTLRYQNITFSPGAGFSEVLHVL